MDGQGKLFISALVAALGATGISPASAAALITHGAKAAASEGGLPADVEAKIVRELGWVFYPPKPKSHRADWQNYAHQTTWWKPFWYNFKTGRVSYVQPSVGNGYRGDDLNARIKSQRWRAGGPPSWYSQSEVESLCAYKEIVGCLWAN